MQVINEEREKNFIEDFDISIISDPHVLAGELMGPSESFIKELKVERKLVVESEGLFRRALEIVDRAGSNYLILPGDMVKEGEYKSHKLVADYLRAWKDKDPRRKIFLTPGNHEINCHSAYDFAKDENTKNVSPREFEEIYDFIYEDDSILEFYRDSQIFKNYLDFVNKKYDRDVKYSYYAHGYFSYVARVKKSNVDDNGLSLIMLDTSIYSADREEKHRDGRENIPGSITKEQIYWILEKIEEAKKRMDMVIVVAHHALLPNFRNQELAFSPFIIKEWRDKFEDDDPRINGKTPIEILADSGVKFVFTGHLHENGTAKYTSEVGNTIYDIQTGSTITYPLPIRHIKINNKTSTDHGFEVFVRTELIDNFSFTDYNGKVEMIDDAILHTMTNQLSLKEVIHNYIRIQANNPLFDKMDFKKMIIDNLRSRTGIDIPYKGYMNDIVFPKIADYFPIYSKYVGRIVISNLNYEYEFRVKALMNTLFIKARNIEEAIDIIIYQLEKILTPHFVITAMDKVSSKIFSMPIDDKGHTFYDFANYIYQYRSTSDEERPSYVSKMIDNINDPDYDIINIVLDYAADEINEVFDTVTEAIILERNGSKKEFFERLIQTKGFPVNFAYKYLIMRVNSLRDLLDFFSRFITKKSSITGVDLAKTIAHSRAVRRAKMNISDKFFGQKSLRVFILALIGEMNEEMTTIYQNADLNEIDHYFNYIEYDDTKIITEE
ncbi:metallophosphoesterase [uncultured Anaerococcus sp.]|uniref:metallophosphoesterase family protein n=1 Tax=uncultured Anaerococcus sp. TaxID=293428 RepID=UPI0028060C2D|nr:metallophosphoesterase [uncultured Anaerococcus sp.]